MRNSEKVALVTGGARGIGQAIVSSFAAQGFTVYSLDLRDTTMEAARQAAEGRSGTVNGIIGDIRDPAFIEETCAGLESRHGAVDILVNNAGITPKKPDGKKAMMEDWSLELWEEVQRVNVTAMFLFCKALVPAMKEKGWGRIINMSSQAGRTKSHVASAAYSASKAAVLGFTRTMAFEIAPSGITANCIAPGRIDTPLAAVAGKEINIAYAAEIPVGRLGTPEDIAAITDFLASDRAGFLTGITIDATGGYFMI